jgi:hypothetical protein
MATGDEVEAEDGGRDSAEIVPKVELAFQLSPEKIAAIRNCLTRGRLKITISRVDLVQGGRLHNGYEYD